MIQLSAVFIAKCVTPFGRRAVLGLQDAHLRIQWLRRSRCLSLFQTALDFFRGLSVRAVRVIHHPVREVVPHLAAHGVPQQHHWPLAVLLVHLLDRSDEIAEVPIALFI